MRDVQNRGRGKEIDEEVGMNDLSEDRTSSRPNGALRSVGALAEVAGVFALGHYLAQPVSEILGVDPLGPAYAGALEASRRNFAFLAWRSFQVLAVQYACLLVLAAGLRWWHRRRSAADFGLTSGKIAAGRAILLGVAAFAVVGIPIRALLVAHVHLDLGQSPPLWQLLEKQWTPAFWLFAAVASFVLVAFLEELFYRGYCQGRLGEDLPEGHAIGIASVLFVLTHSQYHEASVLAVGTVLGISIISVGLGFLYARTGSLLAPVVCHGLLNIPIKESFQLAALTGLVIIVVLVRRPAANVVSGIVAVSSALPDRRNSPTIPPLGALI